jgi:uncharacterized Fe-S cluster protein YjdI
MIALAIVIRPMKLNNVVRYFDLKSAPWQKPAVDLLNYYFPDALKKTDSELANIEASNPKTMSRFSSLWEGVPIYFSQRDNFTQPDRTCNSSANAMFLLSYKPWLLWNDGDNEYLKKVLTYGDTTDHNVQTKTLSSYGLKTSWKTDKDETAVRKLLSVKTPVVVNILHRGTFPNFRGGHMILLYDFDNVTGEYIYHDPYGTLKSNYKRGSNGKSNRIRAKEFMDRWQGGYRITT